MCGIAGIVNSLGRASHALVQDALIALERMEHRGARGADDATGDGAGLLAQLPHDLLAATCDFKLPPRGEYALGVLFLPKDQDQAHLEKARFERLVAAEGIQFLGWRNVVVESSILGQHAANTEPFIAHALIGSATERQLYRLRSLCPALMSLSKRTIVYKGLMLPEQLRRYYRDLADPRFESALALVHSRFSTNTLPSWRLAHPFNYLCHNGEINALSGNLNWLSAREEQIVRDLFGSRGREVLPLVRMDRSDSAHLDGMMSLLLLAGYDVAEAMMLLIPEPWQDTDQQNHGSYAEGRQAFYRYHAPAFEPWDGPAAVCFSDGRFFGAALDRNGLRPCRYAVTNDGCVMVASEMGAFPFEINKTAELGRLAPGGLLVVDTKTGRIVKDSVIKDEVSGRRPYASWLKTHHLHLDQLPFRASQVSSSVPLVLRQRAFGFTSEDLSFILEPMATQGEEPVSSMGVDTPLAVLSDRPRPLFDYFVQSFAQVTNPPIDPLREQRVMSASSFLGVRPALGSTEPPAGVILELPHPVLDEVGLAKIRRSALPSLISIELALTFSARGNAQRLRDRLVSLQTEAVTAARAGATVVILSDRGVNPQAIAIPSLLGVAAVHQALVRAGLRTQTDIIVESGDSRSVHDLACLVGYGATAVHPHMALESLKSLGFDDGARKQYIKALVKGLLKVLSKMGISVLQSYCGAGLFEALGLDHELVENYFVNTTTRLKGLGLAEIQLEAERRHAAAFQANPADGLEHAGIIHFRTQGERHRWSPQAVHTLQEAARKNNLDSYQAFVMAADGEARQPSALRDLFTFKEAATPVALAEVEPAAEIVKRFTSGAMSLGAISTEAHEALAVALNTIGGRSNSGEGGEDSRRFGTLRNSRIKQVASGRFGVTAHYLMSASEIQIKMAQGAKPGEGGQLPGNKVDALIARLRHATPGVSLISPPPHHDIYSIEDLAQLIFDLRQVNPLARISVKLVARAGVGTVAAGVAKARANKIVISGDSGGTGAAALSSIKHVGVPWELGLAEAHQVLVENGLRSRVILETDGQLRTGRDVVLAALLGADEFGFATAPLIALGCVMMRKCHLNICPVGIATQDPELRRKFTGQPEHVINYFFQVAEDVRQHMARLGFRRIADMVGRRDCLQRVPKTGHWKADFVSIEAMLQSPVNHGFTEVDAGVDTISRVDQEMLARLVPGATLPQHLVSVVDNFDRAIGARLSGHVVSVHGAQGLPKDSLRLELTGIAGQSFGAFLASGITLKLKGLANDYVGKGLCGGVIAISSPMSLGSHLLVGNTALYGATSGELYVAGKAGERFAVRNSGATAVVEGVGDHACEYMTGGVVLILGETGLNFAAGMSGGRAYVLDEDGQFRGRCNLGMVSVQSLHPDVQDGDDLAQIWQLLRMHAMMTGSVVAQRLLLGGREVLSAFVRVIPREYEHVLQRHRTPLLNMVQHESRP